jgi:hypothetical protein
VLACTFTGTATPLPGLPTTVSQTAPLPAVTSSPTSTPAVAITLTPSATQPGGLPGLTLDVLRNGTYFAPAYKRTVTLTNGSYSEGSGASGYNVGMLDVYALGDLNGDGANDAALILVENGGGSGQFESLIVVLDVNGMPQQVGQAELGDRVLINSVTLASGQVALDMIVQGPNDPLCCPTQPETQTYRLVGGALWLTRLTSRTPGGDERATTISAPPDGASVSNPFTVSGSVTLAPFENTLASRIFLPDGTQVNESPVTVDSGGVLGGPGTFRRDFDLSSAGITGTVIIQFLDLSAADGTTLDMDTVVLVLK